MPKINDETRSAILSMMVLHSPNKKLGRTAVMKLAYFLQELKGIPLGYDFRLFTYGPFDSEVLTDLAIGANLKGLKEVTKIYSLGFGYEITPGSKATEIGQELESKSPEIAERVREVVNEFGGLSAAELELRSTIFFADRDIARSSEPTDAENLVERVRQIKPHFTSSTIRERVDEMQARGWLRSLVSA